MSRRLLVLLLATLAVGAGLLTVLVWPESPARLPPETPVVQAGADNRVELSVTELGFEPSPVRVHAGKPITLVVTRQTDKTCATELVVPEAGVKVALPLHVPVTISFSPHRTGVLRYGCGIQMMVHGVLLIE